MGAAVALAGAARAEDAPPLSLNIVETADVWRNLRGGVAVGDTTLNKLLVSATFDGTSLGREGLRAHVQLFKTNGESLSRSRLGDIQTASNIEALSVTRLMDAWVQQDVDGLGFVRVGLMDLNLDFDAIEPAGLFVGSSHGIAPDLSHSGAGGPSIFPVSSLGVEASWTPHPAFSLTVAALDGVPGDPDHPKAFAAVKLSRRDGALLIAQGDYHFAAGAQLSVGAWKYTAPFPAIDPGLGTRRGEAGAYAFVEGPLGGGWSAWLRAGAANAEAQDVSAYVGGGVVRTGLFGRKDDQAGIAVAHAVLGSPIRRRDGLPPSETAVEATYLLQLNRYVALQPDVQYIVHPAAAPGLRNALAVGLRVILTGRWPSDAAGDYD